MKKTIEKTATYNGIWYRSSSSDPQAYSKGVYENVFDSNPGIQIDYPGLKNSGGTVSILTSIQTPNQNTPYFLNIGGFDKANYIQPTFLTYLKTIFVPYSRLMTG